MSFLDKVSLTFFDELIRDDAYAIYWYFDYL